MQSRACPCSGAFRPPLCQGNASHRRIDGNILYTYMILSLPGAPPATGMTILSNNGDDDDDDDDGGGYHGCIAVVILLLTVPNGMLQAQSPERVKRQDRGTEVGAQSFRARLSALEAMGQRATPRTPLLRRNSSRLGSTPAIPDHSSSQAPQEGQWPAKGKHTMIPLRCRVIIHLDLLMTRISDNLKHTISCQFLR